MELKSDLNSQEFAPKPKAGNINNNDENTTSDIHSINKIFSNANSIIGINVRFIYIFKNIIILQDEHQFLENLNIDDLFPPNDTFYINSNLGDSNFFSFCGDKSSVFKNLNENENEKDDEDNKSNFTFDSELEKQVGLLTEEEEDDDLNKAKLNLENEDSNWSSISVLKLSNHNMTIPANKNIFNLESEDKSSINTNITQNNTLKNIPYSSIFNCMKSNNTNNIMNSNFDDIRKFSSSSLYNNKTQDIPQLYDTKTNSINNITNMTNRTNFKNGYGIWNLKHGVNINLNNRQFNNKYYGINQSYDFQYNSLGLNNNMKFFNNPNRISNNNNTQILSNLNPINNSIINQININNELKFNQFDNNFNIHQNNFINHNPNQNNNFYYNNFNKSQLSQISLNSLSNTNSNTSNMNKNMNKKNNNKINYKYNYKEKIKNYNEKLLLMIKSQNGSKSIQKKIEEKSSEFSSKLYEQIKNNLFEIINDQYGNYVIQKLVEHCEKKIISSMLKKLSYNLNLNSDNIFYNKIEKNYLYEISINPYGTRALQKMLDNLSSSMTEEDINIILKFSKGNIYSMIKDINGNHVVQSIIENIENKDYLSVIYKEMTENIVNILKTKSGSCCVFPKVIENINENDLDIMINVIIDNIDKLINDENGNFSIQKIIKLNQNMYNNRIYNYIQDKIVKLSMQKFSSNVIETFLISIPNYKDKIIYKIIESNNIINLLSDKYGNYIIQKALSYCNIEDFNTMIKYIKNNIKALKQGSSHGKKIYEKLLKNYKQYLIDDENIDTSSSNNMSNSQNSVKNNFEKKIDKDIQIYK